MFLYDNQDKIQMILLSSQKKINVHLARLIRQKMGGVLTEITELSSFFLFFQLSVA